MILSGIRAPFYGCILEKLYFSDRNGDFADWVADEITKTDFCEVMACIGKAVRFDVSLHSHNTAFFIITCKNHVASAFLPSVQTVTELAFQSDLIILNFVVFDCQMPFQRHVRKA